MLDEQTTNFHVHQRQPSTSRVVHMKYKLYQLPPKASVRYKLIVDDSLCYYLADNEDLKKVVLDLAFPAVFTHATKNYSELIAESEDLKALMYSVPHLFI